MGNTQAKPLDTSGHLPASLQSAAMDFVADEKGTTPFCAYLKRFLTPSVDRLALVLSNQSAAIYDLADLKTEPYTLRKFIAAVSDQGLSHFWRTEVAADSAFTDWVIGQTDTNALSFDDDSEAEAQRQRAKWLSDASTFGTVSLEQWQKWWSKNTVVHELLSLALAALLPAAQLRSVRETTMPQLSAKFDGLLQGPLAWALFRELPAVSQNSWERAYSSLHDGRSWSSFQAAVEQRGALLLLVKEKNGGILGAYLDADLERRPSWYGSSLNFVFSAGPAGLGVFCATGFNDHYQYFNYGTKTLPNGLGVGGQMGNFGLWVDVDFMSGQSCTSATYAAPQLAERSEFEIEHVEAWVVRRSKREDEGRQRSAMDANPDAVAILEMANRTMYSKMVREPALDDD